MTNKIQTLRIFGEVGSASLAIASAVLIFSSFSDIAAKSRGSYSWGDESSFMALQLRSMGFQKLGLGIAIGTLASARIKLNDSESLGQTEPDTEFNKAQTNDNSIKGKRWDNETQTWVKPS